MSAFAAIGWCAAMGLGSLALMLRRRLELVACAEHELRGSFTGLSLVVETVGREPQGGRSIPELETHLDRAHVALADLTAALAGKRSSSRPHLVSLDRVVRTTVAGWRPAVHRFGRTVEIRWAAGPVTVQADDRRLAQAIGNLICNAVEHGDGGIEVNGRRTRGGVRLEVSDGGAGFERRRSRTRKGRGLKIATQAVEDAGGILTLPPHGGRGGGVAVELPVEHV